MNHGFDLPFYLRDVDLPAEEILSLRFYSARPYDLKPGYIIIGEETPDSLIGVDPGGHVYLLDEPRCFLASSPQLLVKLLRAYRALPPLPADCSEDDLVRQASGLRGQIAALDPAALQARDGFWPLILEQVADGLL